MKRSIAHRLSQDGENYVFYTLLMLVLAIAAFGIYVDLTAGR